MLPIEYNFFLFALELGEWNPKNSSKISKGLENPPKSIFSNGLPPCDEYV